MALHTYCVSSYLCFICYPAKVFSYVFTIQQGYFHSVKQISFAVRAWICHVVIVWTNVNPVGILAVPGTKAVVYINTFPVWMVVFWSTIIPSITFTGFATYCLQLLLHNFFLVHTSWKTFLLFSVFFFFSSPLMCIATVLLQTSNWSYHCAKS